MSATPTVNVKTVLVVEDDDHVQDVVRMALEDEGYHVWKAADGWEGLQAVALRMPDLILLDLRMPRMNGREFARAFHARYGAGVPIVIVTANQDLAEDIQEIGAAGCLGKPFDLSELAGMVERHAGAA